MSNQEHQEDLTPLKALDATHSTLAAQKLIQLFEQVKRPNEEQRALLAAAHYTLATQKESSYNQSKMHLNSSIALLKNIPVYSQQETWGTEISLAYFKRAELLEEKNQFITASQDYLKVIEILEHKEKGLIQDEDRVLLAQASISIADLMVNEQIDLDEATLPHPLFFVNKALEHLAKLYQVDDDIWAIYAYAHQTAAIALSTDYFEESKEAFRVALVMAFKTKVIRICPLLADIYTSLGILYEQQQICPAHKAAQHLFPYTTLYFGLSLLFNPNEIEENEEDTAMIESLFEIIYQALDPYLPPLSHQAVCDLIDALIYVYLCIIDKMLPNRTLTHQLNQPGMLDTFAQHIYWLVMEAYRKKHPRTEAPTIIEPIRKNIALGRNEILAILQNTHSNNIYYFDSISQRDPADSSIGL